jgi:hypothetical protein
MSRYALAQPIHINNVSIVPVVSRESEKTIAQDYATLSEAKKNAWIEIIEKPGAAEVDTLWVRNVGPKPILLLSGELLLGGKQDRVVAKDTIVPPGKEVEVPVFCVEPGRWEGASQKFSYGETMVPLKVKEQAAFGDQEGVWASVGGYNAAAEAPADGGSTISNGLKQAEVQKQIADNLEKVLAQLGLNKNVVGVMFLVDGEMQTLELFGNSRLFDAAKTPLLKGALAQAAIAEGRPASKVDLKACATFMSEAMRSSRSVESRSEEAKSVATRRDSANTRGREVHYAGSAPGDGDSALLHGTYGKK